MSRIDEGAGSYIDGIKIVSIRYLHGTSNPCSSRFWNLFTFAEVKGAGSDDGTGLAMGSTEVYQL